MIRILHTLPVSVELSGRTYPIHTDFRDWINFELLLLDKNIPDEEKALSALGWFDGDDIPASVDDAIKALIWFYTGGNKLDEPEAPEEPPQPIGRTPKIVYDFEEDAELIYTSFLDGYGIDLHTVEYLHWWKFRAMLLHIPERTRLAKTMAYRAADEKDLSKQEKKLKRLLEVKGRKPPRQTLQQRDEAMKAYIKQRMEATKEHVKR